MPVRLEVYQSRVADLWTDVDLEKDLKTASVKVHAHLEGQHGGSAVIRIGLKGKTVAEEKVDVGDDGVAHATFKVQSPDLWYPHGYGKQQRYDISAAIVDGTTEIHSVTKKIGLRRAELVQQPDKHGKSFYFRINNVDVFCGGSDWIPADSFTPRITDAKYRRWLELMVDGNQVMIRNWGGGIWEPEIFYDLCDELGIMVSMYVQVYPNLLTSSRSGKTSSLDAATTQHSQLFSNRSRKKLLVNSSVYATILQ